MRAQHIAFTILFAALVAAPTFAFACPEQQTKAENVSTKTWAKNTSKQEKIKAQAVQDKKASAEGQNINLATEPTTPTAK